jgi:antitoxin component of MazEF toxin-antitoxin module
MRRQLSRIGNSWGLIVPKEVLELLGLEGGGEVDLHVVGETLVLTAADLDPSEIEAGLAYLVSKRERAELYRRLAI